MKEVRILISNGAIVPVENCTFDGTTGILTFVNEDLNCSFTIEPFGDSMVPAISMGNYTLPRDTEFIILEAHSDYDDIVIGFAPKDDDDFCERLLGA